MKMARADSLTVYQKSVADFKPTVKGYQAVFIDPVTSINGKLQTWNSEVLLSHIELQWIMNVETKV